MSDISLTLYDEKIVSLDSDSIFYVKPFNGGSIITTKDGRLYSVKESKNRILKMIQAAKYRFFILGEK